MDRNNFRKIKVAKENKNTLKESSIKILGKEIDKNY